MVRLAALATVFAALAAGCNAGSPPPTTDVSCPALSTDCPSTVPSYRDDVTPILESRCNGCHVPGPEKPWPFDNRQDVVDWKISILADMKDCSMPPADAGARSASTTAKCSRRGSSAALRTTEPRRRASAE
jgi:hypothetical protein